MAHTTKHLWQVAENTFGILRLFPRFKDALITFARSILKSIEANVTRDMST